MKNQTRRDTTEDRIIRQRINLPTDKGHAEIIRDIEPKLRAQAFFSARVAEAHILDRLREVSDAYSRGELGLGEARNRLKDFLRAEGYDPKQGGMRNLASTARLNLIFEQNAAMTHAAAEWKRMHDPDAMKVFPYVRYHASVTSKVPRPDHQQYDGMIFDKNDPWLRTHTPPWDFKCHCQLEEITAKEAGKTPELIRPPTPADKVTVDSKSGFSFDPEHVFEEFDPGLIQDETMRAEVIRDMRQQYNVEYHESKLWWSGVRSEKESGPIDRESVERAAEETQKVLPNAIIRWYTPEAEQGSRDPRHVVHDVDALNRINRELHRLEQQAGGLGEIKMLTAEHLDPTIGGMASVRLGKIGLNIAYLNGYDWSKHPQKDGRYTDSTGLLFVGHEIECTVSHEVWHLKCAQLFGDGLPDEQITSQMLIRRKKLVETYKRAAREGILPPYAATDEWEFFSEIKVWEEFDKSTLPEYIKAFLAGLKL